MEAVPKLPMIFFELKISPICPDFSTPFKRFITKYYSEDGDSYEREIHELETLRNNACRAPRDFTGCSLLKRYYSQIHSLQNRFSVFDSNVGVQCVWADIYSGQTVIGDLDLELAAVLYNIGALHAELGALDLRNNAENMKISCTHFQCAVWAFQRLLEDSRLYKTRDMSHDILSFFIQVMLAQAQECILEKSMLDNRKSSIVAKVAAQVVEYYSSALLLLLQAALNTSGAHTILDIVSSKLYKEWKKFIEFKVAYYNSICSLFMGNLAEEQQKMGERVAWFQSAEEKLNESIKLSKQIDRSEINEALAFVSDVISVKLTNAKKENDFVYHEKVPTSDKLTEVKGASLVKGIPFNVCDPEISGPDIFARLVPIEAHETASIYTAKKDEILRNIRIKIDNKNQELAAYMSSLQIEKSSLRSRNEQIPDELIDICATISVNPNCLNEVNDVLCELEEISEDVDNAIKETKNLIQNEEVKEKEHHEVFGERPPSMIVVELNKELAKHEETHKKALLSNSSLRENLERHCDDVKLLIRSTAKEVASLLPSISENVPYDESNLAEMEKLLEKVEEMKTQRSMLENQLKEAMAADDIMKHVLAHTKQEIDSIFEKEIKKYDKIISLLEQNLSAQDNILRALTKANAKYAETRRAFMENQQNRKARIASLIHTFEVFNELQTNSKKGLEFYKKFQNIVSRLLARTRGVSRVQDEERTQFALAHKKLLKNKENYKNVSLNNRNIIAAKVSEMSFKPMNDQSFPVSKLNNYQPFSSDGSIPHIPNVPQIHSIPPIPSVSQGLTISQIPINQTMNIPHTPPIPQRPNNSHLHTLTQNTTYPETPPIYQPPAITQVPPVYQNPPVSGIPLPQNESAYNNSLYNNALMNSQNSGINNYSYPLQVYNDQTYPNSQYNYQQIPSIPQNSIDSQNQNGYNNNINNQTLMNQQNSGVNYNDSQQIYNNQSYQTPQYNYQPITPISQNSSIPQHQNTYNNNTYNQTSINQQNPGITYNGSNVYNDQSYQNSQYNYQQIPSITHNPNVSQIPPQHSVYQIPLNPQMSSIPQNSIVSQMPSIVANCNVPQMHSIPLNPDVCPIAPIVPNPAVSQPQSTPPKPDESPIHSDVPNPQMDLLKQFDPLFDLNNK